MADNFNLAKFLRNNRLLNEGIGGYKDIVPYAGAEKKLDGFGDEFDQVAPVEEAEMEENAWMEDVDGTDAYKVGNWTCYYDHPGLLVWSYKDIPFSKLAIYATPNYDGDDTTPIQIDVNGENDDMMALNQGIFADFNEYARAMKPYLDRIEDLESNWGSLAPVEEMEYDDDRDDVDPLPSLSPKYTGDSESDDPDADIVNDFVQGMRPYYEKDPSFIKRVIDAIRGKGFGAKMYDAGFRMNEAEEEDAYFDYKNNRRSFLPSPDEFQGALDSSEMSQQDFMMSLAHKDFDGDVSAIVKKTIDGLRAGGFDDQDIIDFLATDFSLDEEVSGVQMETRMISYDSDKQIDGKLYDVDLGFKSFRAVYDADNEEFIFQYPDKGGRKSISKYDDSIKRVELHNPIKSPFSDPGYKNRD